MRVPSTIEYAGRLSLAEVRVITPVGKEAVSDTTNTLTTGHSPVSASRTGPARSGGCPVAHGQVEYLPRGGGNRDWWPNRLDLRILQKNNTVRNPMDEDFDYSRELAHLDFEALRRDVQEVMTTSQDWCPTHDGHYGPLFVRMALHAAATYRVSDGHGGTSAGMQRFAPMSNWPENADLNKARQLLWPVKKKYGKSISWGDLVVFAGNCGLASMGLEIFGFGAGRVDLWEPDEAVYWSPDLTWLGDERYTGTDPVAASKDIRATFARMAMNDVETAALIVGGDTFGKTHGAREADSGSPELAGTLDEDAWSATPQAWDNSFLETLYGYEWQLFKGHGGACHWIPKAGADADDTSGTHAPVMLTTDLALRIDPVYEKITRNWLENPQQLAEDFAKAWFKLTHHDMGPVTRYRGPLVPNETLLWQDPVPAVDHDLVDAGDISFLKNQILESGPTVAELVSTAWASASSFRGTDKRGGANGGRIRLEPQASWEANDPATLARVVLAFEKVQESFNTDRTGNTRISFADLVVLGGAAAIEQAAKGAGLTIEVPFTPGRTDATQEQTDVESFAALEPPADGFRNYSGEGSTLPGEFQLVDKANQLTLTAPEMTVLVGGLRVLGAVHGQSSLGVLTSNPGTLTNDFFANLIDLGTSWTTSSTDPDLYVGTDRVTGDVKWTGTRVDLAFGSNSELKALAEVYASDDAQEKFVRDFVSAWDKVMNLDRFVPD